MNLHLENKLALVTASSGGIGFEIARSLVREGARVVINGRTSASVDKATKKLRAEFPQAKLESLAVENGTAEGCAATIQAFPEVDILVNNLGVYEVLSFFNESDDIWQRLFEVNMMSGVRLTRHYLHTMLTKKTGRVIFISSEASVRPPEDMTAYSATKAMQLSLAKSLANLTKGTEVTVNTISPGSTKTEGVEAMLQKMFPDLSAEAADKKYILENRPTIMHQRFIKPEEVADAVTFLCSVNAASINGAVLRVDAGTVHHIV